MNEVGMDRIGMDGLDGLAGLKRTKSARRLLGKRRQEKEKQRQQEQHQNSQSRRQSLPHLKQQPKQQQRSNHVVPQRFEREPQSGIGRGMLEQKNAHHRRSWAGREPANVRGNGSKLQQRTGTRSIPDLRMTSSQLDVVALLREQGFSTGLAKELYMNSGAFAYRIWIVDNSGSMQLGDGHRIVTTSDRNVVCQEVTRWEEIQETVAYHCGMAALLKSPSKFKLLNHPGPRAGHQEFNVGFGRTTEEHDRDIRQARTVMQRAVPTGVTPLTDHVWEIQAELYPLAPTLRREGQRVVVVLATDGLPTDREGYGGPDVDEEFIQSLKSLEGLPVWLVIRLCTDEDKVTDFYNSLDKRLDLNLEVLDDYYGEAFEVKKHNPWLNYSLPMHRCRELGYHNRIFDYLDERPLTKGELRDFCALIFGITAADSLPDPLLEWKDFLRYIRDRLALEDDQFNPVRKRKMPLMDLRSLHRIYGKENKCAIM